MTRIARVFPRITKMTPTDELAFVDCYPPLLTMPEIDEVHISVTFTWDLPCAERLASAWEAVGVPVSVGGPALNRPSFDFVPGRYIKAGCVFTSRGCPNHCWFCAVPKREGGLRELPITPGWNILDDNLLACSDAHIEAVFDMLSRQPTKPLFTGGLEAKRLKAWHVDRIRQVRTKRAYFAYDTPDDYEPLVAAGKLLRAGGITAASHTACCYCLIGWKGDTFDKAEQRLIDTIKAGFVPYAMLYKDKDGNNAFEWKRFQREWVRSEIVASKMKSILGGNTQ